ncbi:hypothetical protein BDV95DRAFT_448492, partial [Massariosphaeria phaeospora]
AAPMAPKITRLPKHFVARQENNTIEDGTCKLDSVPQPANTLKAPTPDISLMLIALGRGTQNYTCADASAATLPTQVGAVAQLFNASCAVANNALGQIDENPNSIGMHFFADLTTPEFDIPGVGNTQAKKVDEMNAPNAANIKWLRLEAKQETSTSAVRQIYRLNTVGGLAPKNCEGQTPGAVITVQYQAQYWIYA